MTATLTQGTSTEDSHAAPRSLDQRFTDKDRRTPVTARSQSLDRRFGGKEDEQLHTTAPDHLWSMVKACDSGVNRPTLDRRFTCTGDPSTSSGSAALPLTGTLDNGEAGHSMVTADQLPSSVTARQDSNELHVPSSHGTGTSNVCHQTTEQPLHSSIIASAGAQHWITDKASTTDMNASTRGNGTFGDARQSIGSTESRLATLRWSLDLNEADRPASLNVDSIELRSSSPAASAKGGSSIAHPRTEGPGGRKHCNGGSQVNQDCVDVTEDSVTCGEHRSDRFMMMMMMMTAMHAYLEASGGIASRLSKVLICFRVLHRVRSK